MRDYVVIRSGLILDAREARRYYEERFRGLHVVECHGRQACIFFDSAANHVYTREPTGRPDEQIIERRIGPGRFDNRVFCLDRAHLMDDILPALRYYTFTIPGTGLDTAHNRLVHGPRLPDGRYMRVALGPGPRSTWLVKSAYPIEARLWLELRRAKTVKFPP